MCYLLDYYTLIIVVFELFCNHLFRKFIKKNLLLFAISMPILYAMNVELN